MRWESVSQLTGVRRQIQRHLLQLIHHQSSCAFIAAELAACELLSLANAANNGPHQ
jgi:hypothetical protein